MLQMEDPGLHQLEQTPVFFEALFFRGVHLEPKSEFHQNQCRCLFWATCWISDLHIKDGTSDQKY